MKEEYTNGEMSILVSGFEKKLDKVVDSIDKLAETVDTINEFKAETKGMIRSTIFWTSALTTIIVGIGGLVLNLSMNNMEQRMLLQNEQMKDITKQYVIDYLNDNFDIKDVAIKK